VLDSAGDPPREGEGPVLSTRAARSVVADEVERAAACDPPFWAALIASIRAPFRSFPVPEIPRPEATACNSAKTMPFRPAGFRRVFASGAGL